MENYPVDHGDQLLFLTEDRLRELTSLLFFAYRSFTSDADKILAEYGYGRAHHRAIYFVHQRPELKVSELIDILGITKQSLNRVLRTLIADGYVAVKPGELDRRERRLQLTENGKTLEARLASAQHKRLREAFAEAGPDAVAGLRKSLGLIIDNQMRVYLEKAPENSTDTT